MTSPRVRLIDPAAAPILARPYFADEGETSPIVRALAQVPELLPATMPFLGAILGPSAIDLRTKELVILRVSADAACGYCIGAHRLAARDAGVNEHESLALIGALPLAEAFDDDEVALLELADTVAHPGPGADAVVARVRDRLGDHGLVEIVLLASATLMLNRFCSILRLPTTAATAAGLQALETAAAT